MTMQQVKTKVIENRYYTKILSYTDEAGVFQIDVEFEKPIPLESAEKIRPVIVQKQSEKTIHHNAGQVVKV